MPVRPEQVEAANAALEVIRQMPPGMREVAINAQGRDRAMASVDQQMKSLYESAESCHPTAVADLRDPIKYAAMGILLMKHARSPRSKEKMFMHLGKVFGHDSKNINIDDKRSFKDVLAALQDEFKRAVPVHVVVREASNGETAT